MTGPYHQAGPEKLITLSRSGLTWMSPAITSMRFDSNDGITDSHGIQTTLIFLTPKHVEHGLVDVPVDAGGLLVVRPGKFRAG